jgi:hypothetical protein
VITAREGKSCIRAKNLCRFVRYSRACKIHITRTGYVVCGVAKLRMYTFNLLTHLWIDRVLLLGEGWQSKVDRQLRPVGQRRPKLRTDPRSRVAIVFGLGWQIRTQQCARPREKLVQKWLRGILISSVTSEFTLRQSLIISIL